MISPLEVQALFDTLAAGAGGLRRGEYRVLDAEVHAAAGSVLLALDEAGAPHVMIAVDADEEILEDRRSSGVHVVARMLEEDGRIAPYIDLVCRKPHFANVFHHLAAEVLSAVEAAPESAATSCHAALARWRELLEKERRRVLGDDALTGLYGELWHLREIARTDARCLPCWKGPEKGRHDFERGETALEVKSTTRREGRFVSVHGAEQLELPAGGRLFLAVMRVEPVEAGGETLMDVVEDIRVLGVDFPAFLAKLLATGFDLADADYYDSKRFHLKEARMYAVDDAFPRIVPSSFRGGTVPPGVLGIKLHDRPHERTTFPAGFRCQRGCAPHARYVPIMQALDLQSERFQPTGSISADGVRNQLGRPSMDRLTLLVRETVQNSWDARRGDVVDYSIRGWTFTPKQHRLLFGEVLAARPQVLRLPEPAGGPVAAIAIADRRTTGLGGPTRADAVPAGEEPTDFVDFLRNVGQPPDRMNGGGTYGFGKASLYLASSCRTILVHTHCIHNGRVESRLMAAALGPQYKHAGGRYTGRHWWGRRARDGIVDPLVGQQADQLAELLGLPGFAEEETGTTIVVLAPDLSERSEKHAAALMGDAILRYFWPKMFDGPKGGPSMHFSVSWAGQAPVDLRPELYPPLDAYARAFRAVQAARAGGRADGSVQEVRCMRPQQHLGLLSIVSVPTRPRRTLEGAPEGDSLPPFSTPGHAVALMRSPHLVVDYVEGPPLPDGHVEYAGVFVAAREVDRAFADAEPPTHDAWVPNVLENRRDQTFVRVALRRIREALIEYTAPPSISGGTGEDVPLGAFADQLGGLIPGEDGGGAGGVIQSSGPGSEGGNGPEGTGGGRRGGSSRPFGPRVAIAGRRHAIIAGLPALVVEFTIDHAGAEAVVVEIDAKVLVLDGSFESDPPQGAEEPRVLQWVAPDGRIAGDQDRVRIAASQPGHWSVAVSIPDDASISVGLTAMRA